MNVRGEMRREKRVTSVILISQWDNLQFSSEDLPNEIRWSAQRNTPARLQTLLRERLKIREKISGDALRVRECKPQLRYLLELSHRLRHHSGTIWRKPEAPGV